MTTKTRISAALVESCDCGPHEKPVCPYCHKHADEPNHLNLAHPLPKWWMREQQRYIDRIVAAHEAVGEPYFGIRSVYS